jgi:hypothetical protein
MACIEHPSFRHASWVAVVALVCLIAALPTNAEQKAFAYELKNEWLLALPRGSTVVVRIPTRFWQVEKDQRKDLKIWTPFKDERGPSGTGLAYFVEVEDLLNLPDWASSGFPFCGEFTLTKIFELRSPTMHHKLPYTEVELQSGNVYLRLHLSHLSSEAGILNTELQKLVVAGNWGQFESSEDFRKNVFAVQDAKIFTGPMSRLSYGVKVALMHMACNGQGTFAAETFKGRTYFAVTLQSDGEVYNSNKLNSLARIALVINERIIAMIKTFKSPAQESGIDGLKFTTSIDYHNFVNESQTHQDQLEIYLPLDLLVKFVDADITSQQLIDGSIVLLNGDRIQVSLTVG